MTWIVIQDNQRENNQRRNLFKPVHKIYLTKLNSVISSLPA